MKQVEVQNAYFEGSVSEQFLFGATEYGGVRLRGIIISIGPEAGGATIDIKDKESGGVLFSIDVQPADEDSRFSYFLKFPGGGIRFPTGIKFTFTASEALSISLFYQA